MAKKTFKDSMTRTPGAGADAFFSGAEKSPPKKGKKDWKREGCKEGERRFTLIASEAKLEALANIAYWERKTKKQALDEALEAYIQANKATAHKKRK